MNAMAWIVPIRTPRFCDCSFSFIYSLLAQTDGIPAAGLASGREHFATSRPYSISQHDVEQQVDHGPCDGGPDQGVRDDDRDINCRRLAEQPMCPVIDKI